MSDHGDDFSPLVSIGVDGLTLRGRFSDRAQFEIFMGQVYGVAEALWPSEDADGEDSPEEARAAPVRPVLRDRGGGARPIKTIEPGSVSARLIEAVREIGDGDRRALAERLNIKPSLLGMMLTRLQQGGHL
jgi:hypothetical protein